MPTIRDAILDNCHHKYRKVAMVILNASDALEKSDDETYELLGKAIIELVAEGRLEAVGDVSHWRDSEVRKSGS